MRLSEERHIRPRSGQSRPAVPPEARRGGPASTARDDGEPGPGEDGRGAPGRGAGRRSGPGQGGAEGPSSDTPSRRLMGVRTRSETALRRRTTGPRIPPAGSRSRLTALRGSRAGSSRERPAPVTPVASRGLPGVVGSSMPAGGYTGHPRAGGRRARRGRCRAHDGTGRSRPVGDPAGTRGRGDPGRSPSGITARRRGSARSSPGATHARPTRASRRRGG